LVDQTISEYTQVIKACKEVFEKKTKDYGTAWRILRLPSITDQIYIKARRIRSIQEQGRQKVEDGIADEFIGIVNYCIIALVQLDFDASDPLDLPAEKVMHHYDAAVEETLGLLRRKNHDYSEAWRDMRISSITDIILMKIQRVKQIEDNAGATLISEGVRSNYQDMINYAVFCLIKLGHLDEKSSG
jgi:hypothetical protein